MSPDGIYRTGDNFLSSSCKNFLILTANMNTSLTVATYICHTSFLERQGKLANLIIIYSKSF
jgi:hypothetical protein